MNAQLLKSKMVLYGDDDCISKLARLLKITRQTASAKLKGDSQFTQREITLIGNYYGFTDEEIREIFLEGDDEHDSERSCETS